MKKKKTIMKVVCAWCGKDLGYKDDKGQTGTSHGICKECKEGLSAKKTKKGSGDSNPRPISI